MRHQLRLGLEPECTTVEPNRMQIYTWETRVANILYYACRIYTMVATT